jgi:hypothetical protein
MVVIDNCSAVTVMPTVQFGVVGTVDRYLAPEALNAAMNARNKVFSWEIIGDAVDAEESSDIIQFGVTVGSTATTHLATALVEGWLTDSVAIPIPP